MTISNDEWGHMASSFFAEYGNLIRIASSADIYALMLEELQKIPAAQLPAMLRSTVMLCSGMMSVVDLAARGAMLASIVGSYPAELHHVFMLAQAYNLACIKEHHGDAKFEEVVEAAKRGGTILGPDGSLRRAQS